MHEPVERTVVELACERVLAVGVVEDGVDAPCHARTGVVQRCEGAQRERDGTVWVRLHDLWGTQGMRSAIMSCCRSAAAAPPPPTDAAHYAENV